MRYCLIGLLWLSMYSCVERKREAVKSPEIKDTTRLMRSDSFETADLRMLPDLQPGIILDTLESDERGYVNLSLILPRIDGRDLPIVSRFIDSLGRSKKNDFRESASDWRKENQGKPDSLLWLTGLGLWTKPILLYNDGKVLSFEFEDGISPPSTPSWYEFKGINYDIVRKRRIGLSSYFRLDSPADSAFWAHIISRAASDSVGNLGQFLEWHGPVNFAFNKDVIYFFFDRADLFGGGVVGSVKKKYVRDYIREEYR